MKSPTSSTKASYVLLSSLFNLALGLFCWGKKREQISLKDWAMLILATFRMSRMVAYDKVMQTYREPFVEVVPHDSGAGETTQPRPGTGLKRAFGELISCPICNGTWIAAGLVYGLCYAPRYTRTLMSIMSTIGAAEILQAHFEAVQWNGEYLRQKTGEQRRLNQEAAARYSFEMPASLPEGQPGQPAHGQPPSAARRDPFAGGR